MALTKITNPKLFELNSLDTALRLPSGNTISRPSVAVAGEWRYNTDDNRVEYYDGANWFQIDDELSALLPKEGAQVMTYKGIGATRTVNSKFDQAANFSANTEYIQLSSNPLNFGTSNYTISGWINTTNLGANQALVSNYAGVPGGMMINIVQPNGYVRFYHDGGTLVQILTSALTVGTWHHICCTMDHSTEAKIYIDGNLENTKSGSNLGTSAGSTFYIGNEPGHSQYYMQGSIDQLRIYDSALSPSEVLSLYNDETATTASSLNFPSGKTATATYMFDGNANDVSGNFNGTSSTSTIGSGPNALNVGYVGTQFKPDMVWMKIRSTTGNWQVFDSVSATPGTSVSNSRKYWNLQNSMIDDPGGVTAFETNGFTMGSSGNLNTNGGYYGAMALRAGGATTATNSAGAGNIPTAGSVKINDADSTTALAGTLAAKRISANTLTGFSIVNYTSTGTGGDTVAHGLGVAPDTIIFKSNSNNGNWLIFNVGLGDNYLYMNGTSGGSSTNWCSVSNTTFTLNTAIGNDNNTNGVTYTAYCFANGTHFHSGTYTGNGSGAYNNTVAKTITTGFQPSAVILGRSGDSRVGFDNQRINDQGSSRMIYNFAYYNLQNSEAQATYNGGYYALVNFASTGLELGQDPSQNVNYNGATFWYLAIA
jgi:hypothetical protein